MKILAIGDVTSPRGIEHLEKNLWKIRDREKIDFTVVNGENASFISGISPELAERLLSAGADAITGGNHTMHNSRIYNFLDDRREIIRPINFGASAPGRGYTVLDGAGFRVLVINALGNIHMEPTLDSPYPYIDRALSECCGKYDFSILDFHAEATGEKVALGFAYDGKINMIFGTHTHVQTADERILPHGTGYITDIGMCGESCGVIGMDAESTVFRMRSRLPQKFKCADGEPLANGVIFTLDNSTKKVTKVERITF